MYILIESLIFQDEYAEALAVIERSILATDLALHFRDAQALSKLATSISQCPKKLDALITEENSQSKHLMQAGMMTAADLGNATKVKESRDFAAVLLKGMCYSHQMILLMGSVMGLFP